MVKNNTDKDYLTGYDLLRWLGCLDDNELALPVAVSVKVTGFNKPYFDESEPQRDRSKNFDGWILEGLTVDEIKKAKSFGGG